MGGGVDLGELGDRHAGVYLRRLQTLVAEQRLDEPDIGPAFEHQRRGGVAEQMAGAGLLDASGGDVTTHLLRQPLGFERAPVAAEEQRGWIAARDQTGT